MKKKLFVSLFLICVLVAVSLQTAFAQDENVLGVVPGDNFTYTFNVFWSSTNPTDLPPDFSDLNQTESIHFNVTEIWVTTAYVNVTILKVDGTEEVEPGFVDVNTGRGVEAQQFIIGANLTAGDEAYPLSQGPPGAVESFTISGTTTMTYLESSREVNRYSQRTTTADGYNNTDAYYDRQTGVLLEMTLEYYYSVAGETIKEHWKIYQFNEASVTPSDGGTTDGTGATETWPAWILPAIVVVVIVVVVALLAVTFLRRRRKPQVQTPASPPVQPTA
jgi:hypothetical protein